MDDTARLVSELHDKLAELDGKVAAYQRDMLAQFHRHMDDCLKQYPDHVSNEVARVIAASMSKYPALNPNRRGVDSGDISPRSDFENADRLAWDGRKSPPPILYHTSGIPKEGPRSPHQREKEFQGLFTPSYLPLLDSSYCAPQSPPVSPPPTAATFTPSIDEVQRKVEEPKEAEAVTVGEARPGPIRRSTDRSSSSVESSGSETKVRRSALRRSSSSTTKGTSPRRVRFDFEGEEVLPSSSPLAPSIMVALVGGGAEADLQPPTPEPEPEAAAVTIADADTSAIASVDDSELYSGGMSLLDVEGEEDLLPRPRKVSSTQALQALSRSPLDAGTTWTVVNAEPEEAPKMNGDKKDGDIAQADPSKQTSVLSSDKAKLGITVVADNAPADNHRLDELLGSPIEELEQYQDEDASDEEFLSMSTKLTRKTPSPGPSFPFGKIPVPKPVATVDARPKPPPVEDDDPVFDFEDEASGSEVKKYLSDDDAEEEDQVPISERLHMRLNAAANEPTPPLEAEDRATALPPISPSTAVFSQSVGSYKGHPVLLGPTKNQRLYDQISSMKDVHLFVGGIDGKTGVDSMDTGSYRASLAKHVVGTPRSFTERLALEEAMERRRAEREEDE